MWSLLCPWAWIIIPGAHSASSERKRGEKSSHFSRTEAVWSPKSSLRTSSHGTSSSRLNRGPLPSTIVISPCLRFLVARRYPGRGGVVHGHEDRDPAAHAGHRRRGDRR